MIRSVRAASSCVSTLGRPPQQTPPAVSKIYGRTNSIIPETLQTHFTIYPLHYTFMRAYLPGIVAAEVEWLALVVNKLSSGHADESSLSGHCEAAVYSVTCLDYLATGRKVD